ncbi:hypothetical protein ABQF35_12750 [Mycobacterium syngnathidarum]
MRAVTATMICAATIVVALESAPHAGAAYCDPLPNGRFTATSDGVWARTNEVFHDESTVTSTWTISTWCTGAPLDCAGRVVSSQGWDAPISCESAGLWNVRRHHDNWEICPDGTAVPGNQLLYFSADLTGSPSFSAVRTYSGWDRTVGVSGGCGVNQPLVIEMPFRLETSP